MKQKPKKQSRSEGDKHLLGRKAATNVKHFTLQEAPPTRPSNRSISSKSEDKNHSVSLSNQKKMEDPSPTSISVLNSTSGLGNRFQRQRRPPGEFWTTFNETDQSFVFAVPSLCVPKKRKVEPLSGTISNYKDSKNRFKQDNRPPCKYWEVQTEREKSFVFSVPAKPLINKKKNKVLNGITSNHKDAENRSISSASEELPESVAKSNITTFNTVHDELKLIAPQVCRSEDLSFENYNHAMWSERTDIQISTCVKDEFGRSGFLRMDAGSKIGPQIANIHHTVYFVVEGDIVLNLNDQKHTLNKWSSFTVPTGSRLEIFNNNSSTALLRYSSFKDCRE